MCPSTNPAQAYLRACPVKKVLMLALLIASGMNLNIRHPRMHAISSNIGEVLVREHLEPRVNLVVKANQSLSLLKGTPKNIKKLVGSLTSKWYIFGGVLKNGLIYT